MAHLGGNNFRAHIDVVALRTVSHYLRTSKKVYQTVDAPVNAIADLPLL